MSKSRLLSGRIKKLTGAQLKPDRYQYLDAANSEPDLGIPTYTGTSYLVATNTGTRFWKSDFFTFSERPPNNPSIGDRWIDSNTLTEQVFIDDGSSYQWIEIAYPQASGGTIGPTGPAGAAVSWGIVATATICLAAHGYFVDTSNYPVTMTLPVSAAIGDTIKLNDLAGTFAVNSCTVNRNGHKIQGLTADYFISTAQSSIELVYSNSTYGWKIIT